MDNNLSLIDELRLIKNTMHLKNVNEMVLNNLKRSLESSYISIIKDDIEAAKETKEIDTIELVKAQKELEDITNNFNPSKIRRDSILRWLRKSAIIPSIILIVGIAFTFITTPLLLIGVSSSEFWSGFSLSLIICLPITAIISLISYIVLLIKKHDFYVDSHPTLENKTSSIREKIDKLKAEIKEANSILRTSPRDIKYISNRNRFLRKKIKEHESYISTINDSLDLIKKNSSIHEKYFTFVHICQFYEYIDTGRCNKLEGSDGCYNLFELELRLNRIIDRLDTISLTLEEIDKTLKNIEQSMYVLCNEVRAINSQFDSFLKCYETMEKEKGQNFEIINSNLKYIKATQTFLIKDDLPYTTKGLTLLKAYGDLKY